MCLFCKIVNKEIPAKILFEQFGFTADNVVAKANAALAKVGEITGHTTGN